MDAILNSKGSGKKEKRKDGNWGRKTGNEEQANGEKGKGKGFRVNRGRR
jgi:hypothetical protein